MIKSTHEIIVDFFGGDLQRSLAINEDRFGMTPEITRILENTVKDMGRI